jgi:hypothetical protein
LAGGRVVTVVVADAAPADACVVADAVIGISVRDGGVAVVIVVTVVVVAADVVSCATQPSKWVLLL